MRLLPLIFMQRTKQGDLQMERYGQFCPIAKALELVGSRWTPLVLRELLAGGRLFSDIQQGYH